MLSLKLPDNVEALVREAWGRDLDSAVLEALLIQGFRTRKFGISTVRAALGLESRWDAEKWLADRDVRMNYDAADLDADRRTAARLFREPSAC